MIKGICNFRTGALNPRVEPKSDLPSLTVPDQAIPLRTLLDRHVKGNDVLTYPGQYVDPALQIPDGFERMSLIEKAQLHKELSEFVATTRGGLITRAQANKRKRDEEAIIAAHEARKQKALDDGASTPIADLAKQKPTKEA